MKNGLFRLGQLIFYALSAAAKIILCNFATRMHFINHNYFVRNERE